jgi:hypothetical protein
MSRYSVMQEGGGAGCNSVCKSIGEVLDATLDALKRGDKVTIVEIPPEPITSDPHPNRAGVNDMLCAPLDTYGK